MLYIATERGALPRRRVRHVRRRRRGRVPALRPRADARRARGSTRGRTRRPPASRSCSRCTRSARGGFAGTGLGLGSPQKIPNAATDFVFAAIGEELGLIGTIAVLHRCSCCSSAAASASRSQADAAVLEAVRRRPHDHRRRPDVRHHRRRDPRASRSPASRCRSSRTADRRSSPTSCSSRCCCASPTRRSRTARAAARSPPRDAATAGRRRRRAAVPERRRGEPRDPPRRHRGDRVLILVLVAQLTYLQVDRRRQPRQRPAQRPQVPARRQPPARPDPHCRRRGRRRSPSRRRRASSSSACTHWATCSRRSAGTSRSSSATPASRRSYNSVLTGATRPAVRLQRRSSPARTTPATSCSRRRHAPSSRRADALGGQSGSVVALDITHRRVARDVLEPDVRPEPARGPRHGEGAGTSYFLLNADPTKPAVAARPTASSTPRVDVQGRDRRGGAIRPARSPGGPHLSRSRDVPAPGHDDRRSATSAASACGGTLTESFIHSCNTTFGADRLRARRDVRARHRTSAGSVRRRAIAPPLDLDPARSGASARRRASERNRGFARPRIGQGDVFATPLEMALVAAGVANGGVIMEPHVAARDPATPTAR